MKKIFMMLLFVTGSLSVYACDKDAGNDGDKLPPAEQAMIYPKSEGVLRLVSYNVGAFSKYGDSCSMVADMMKEIKADAVCMNELDSCNTRHNYYQLELFAEYAGGWDIVYARAMPYKGGAYGNGIAYSEGAGKAVRSFSIPLKKKSGSEDRVCVVVEFEDYVLAGTHLDVKTSEDRVLGARTITKELKAVYGGKGKPVFLCGDMNDVIGSDAIRELEKDWNRISTAKNTHSSISPNKCIDHFFALKDTGAYTVSSSNVCQYFHNGDVTEASDHLPVFVDIKLQESK